MRFERKVFTAINAVRESDEIKSKKQVTIVTCFFDRKFLRKKIYKFSHKFLNKGLDIGEK